MKIIVTKHACSSGPFVCDAETYILTPGMVGTKRAGYSEYFHGKDWHKDSVSAHNDVVRRFMKKRESLKKQLAKLDDKLANALTAIKESGL